MGNDGGSIPKRHELVKSAARAPTLSELKATALESLAHAWTHDMLNSDPLDMENAVSDWLGRLYNYESVLKGLMPSDGAKRPQESSEDAPEDEYAVKFASTGIKSLRDVVRLKFHQSSAKRQGRPIWTCPVSMKELGPNTRSVYLVPCGHVFAEIAVKEIPDRICPECSEKFDESDTIPILPIDVTEMDRLRRRMEVLKARGLSHSLKKDKGAGKKKRKAGDEEGGSAEKQTYGGTDRVSKPSLAVKPSRVNGINNAMTASLTAKVLAEQDERNKRRKLAAAVRS